MTYEKLYGNISGFCPKCGAATDFGAHSRCPVCDPKKEEKEDKKKEKEVDEFEEDYIERKSNRRRE